MRHLSLLLACCAAAGAQGPLADFDGRGLRGLDWPSALHEAAAPPAFLPAPAGLRLIVDDPRHAHENALREVLAMIGEARESIRYETFIIAGDSGRRVEQALLAKARAGVRVQVLLDPLSQGHEKSLLARLLKPIFDPRGRNNEVPDDLRRQVKEINLKSDPEHPLLEVLDYNAGAKANAPKLIGLPADHAKLVIVDSRRLLVGGTNFDDDATRDVNLAVEDAGLAGCLEELYNQQWSLAGGKVIPARPCRPQLPITAYATREGEARHLAIQAELYGHIDGAKREIDIEMYWLSDGKTLDKIVAAHRRGVAVRVLVNKGERLSDPSNLGAAAELTRAGVPVRSYKGKAPGYLHSKLGIFDEEAVLLGSTNWQPAELEYVHDYEFDVHIPELAAALTRLFDEDWRQNSQPYAPPPDNSPGAG